MSLKGKGIGVIGLYTEIHICLFNYLYFERRNEYRQKITKTLHNYATQGHVATRKLKSFRCKRSDRQFCSPQKTKSLLSALNDLGNYSQTQRDLSSSVSDAVPSQFELSFLYL